MGQNLLIHLSLSDYHDCQRFCIVLWKMTTFWKHQTWKQSRFCQHFHISGSQRFYFHLQLFYPLHYTNLQFCIRNVKPMDSTRWIHCISNSVSCLPKLLQSRTNAFLSLLLLSGWCFFPVYWKVAVHPSNMF